MSYLTQSILAEDEHLMRRVTACAAMEGIPSPDGWAYQHRWELSAQPGWVAAYASARVAHDADPGKAPLPGANEAAITDGQILAAVQAIQKAEEEP